MINEKRICEAIAELVRAMNKCDECPARFYCEEHPEIETCKETLVSWLQEVVTA